MIVYKDQQKIFTTEDYAYDHRELEKIKLNFEEKDFNLEKEDLVCFVPGSMTLSELDAILEQNGFLFNHQKPKDYSLSRFLSESNDLELNLQILGLGLFHADNTISKTGSKVIKNVSGYDLAKIYLGSFNSIAIITGAYIRVEKLPQSQAQIKFHKICNPEELRLILSADGLSYIAKVCSENYDKSSKPKIKIYNSTENPEIYNIFFEINLYGDQTLVNLRTAKLKNKINEYFRKEELLINIEDFKKSELKSENIIYLHTKLDSLAKLARTLIEKGLDGSMELDPKKSTIKISYSEETLLYLSANYTEPLFIDIQPINRNNITIQRKYQKFNDFETQLTRKLKNQFDPNHILNPGILLDVN